MNGTEANPKLSICIPTYNRAGRIGETLESIISQVTADCEIVISDNASTDNTEEVIRAYARRFSRLRYFRQHTNIGVDRNFDCVMQLGRGEYCWLMSDDDVLKPGAIETVLGAAQNDFSLILVNYERKDFRTKIVLLAKAAEIETNMVYEPWELDRLVEDAGGVLLYCGAVVIKRAIWVARERDRYYGSMWIHIGVALQGTFPGKSLLIAAPLISYREGNAKSYMADFLEILMIKLPSVVWSLPISESAKNAICRKEPWRRLWSLLLHRAAGCYSYAEYRRLIRPRLHSSRDLAFAISIAWLPRVLTNCFCVLSLSLSRNRNSNVVLAWLKDTPFFVCNLLQFRRKRPSLRP